MPGPNRSDNHIGCLTAATQRASTGGYVATACIRLRNVLKQGLMPLIVSGRAIYPSSTRKRPPCSTHPQTAHETAIELSTMIDRLAMLALGQRQISGGDMAWFVTQWKQVAGLNWR